ncbi:mitochondrial ribosomal protein MRP51 [Microdochium trichocladiopsis]|uniref:Mitochondrial ribosomal protein MRP51 n=1 Tax=Microdochium trichocladiopsis TaxID=1682393 RepID=A0A9P9BQV7_9PEZI|nr:mitochondrial ribosomal protein MRP51 [Microdochium trichocladiopsis]KAH7031307.1 mitochondrial ribosomal protein MRP51 [Microdochium trichocladiopsis]
MTTPAVSPGAALLRASRMFSLPAAISSPPGDWSTATKHHSDTATKHFPTRLSVTTTQASRVNGDWGFKRSFPAKTTSKQTIPLIRINKVDAIEEVTDFDSASDHSLTLLKFQEMNMAITTPPARKSDVYDSYTKPVSVFEEDSDITAFEPGQETESENKRWRFNGPWLAGMADGDFEKYLNKNVRNRRADFRAYLKQHMAKEQTAEKRRTALEAGQDDKQVAEVAPEAITDEIYTENLRRLRADRIELYRLISRFLDLAPVSIEAETQNIGAMAHNVSREFRQTGPYSVHGPPITHPSAGLSYLRTRNFQENHPLYGPQREHAPVKSRVLHPRHPASGVFNAMIGTGGFVAQTSSGDTVTGNRRSSARALEEFDLSTKGGAKKYFGIRSATVDSNGRINVAVDDSFPQTVMVHQETLGEAEVWKQSSKASNSSPGTRGSGRPAGTPHRAFASGKSYGLSSERKL